MPTRPSRQELRELPQIGWREWVALPTAGVRYIKVKVDTGARTSALHAFDVETVRRRGIDCVRFSIHPLQRSDAREVEVVAELIDERYVKNSGGLRELRPVVRLEVELLDVRWPVEVTLTNRDQMGFRMLLGRQAVRNRFLVDPGRSFLGGRRKVKKARKP